MAKNKKKHLCVLSVSAVKTILYHGCADLTNRTGRIVPDLGFSDADIDIHCPNLLASELFYFLMLYNH